MVSSYGKTVQNTAKCPHGFPVGTCPICSGMGGGSKPSKNRDKPRVPGEMSYNECLAEWHKIQARKQVKANAKLQHAKNIAENISNNKILKNIEKLKNNIDKTLQNINNLPFLIKTPIKIFLNIIVKPVVIVAEKIVKNTLIFFNNIFNFINSVTEKLAMFYGEIKNFNDNIIKKTKKSLKTLLSLFVEEETEENEEAEKVRLKELKKVFRNFFETKNTEEERTKC